MLYTYKPTNVFICDNSWNGKGKNIVTIKFEIPCTADKWMLEQSGRWVMRGTLNLSDIITSNTYEIKEEFRNWEFNDRIANQIFMNMISASMSLVLPCLNTPLKQRYVTMSNMDQFEFCAINPHYITYGVDCEFADADGLFMVGNAITLRRPNVSHDYEKNTYVDVGKVEAHYLDECVLVISIDVALSGFQASINEAIVHSNNPYAIFGIMMDSNIGKPRIQSCSPADYASMKSTLEIADGVRSGKYQLFPVDYTKDSDFEK